MSKRPAFQLYTGDWLKDPNLSMCTPLTRGIWIDLICSIHELNSNGKITGSYEQLSRICRCTKNEITNAIDELKNTKTANVTICNGNVTVTSRRMKREYEERDNTKKRVSKHRKKKCNANETQDVTPLKQNCNASRARFSSSSSSSSTTNTPLNPPRGTDRFSPKEIEIDTEAKKVISMMNDVLGKNLPYFGGHLDPIRNRLRENVLFEQLEAVVRKKMKDPHFKAHPNQLNPFVLFGKKFQMYLHEDENAYQEIKEPVMQEHDSDVYANVGETFVVGEEVSP